ncbi:phage holin family protein [Paracoccus tibetensis]|uniref:4 TMS phage holin, superfamily IV n=1 Tax=Paracoccus tibetensis TaxID=336292 RepID=A0A1G5CYH5_9RHOB|nr:phage holin family protein [Paracoccus tibetensis]SCY07250.1 4 TMS phage holin, superfamily IV [Paracoccus tibetensis]
MVRMLLSTLAYLAANAVGLLLAATILPGFRIDVLSFLLVVILFSVLQAVLGPLISRMAAKRLPQVMGGIALVTIFVGLWITDRLLSAMEIGGISNWLAATLLVWLGSLIATILLPIYVFKSLGHAPGARGRA